MSEDGTQSDRDAPGTAGTMLRQARQARGLHLMALSASLKVPAARLEAMEADRWHELPDASYARALAHTVSRALGIDPQPVLRVLPAASEPRLETLDEGLDEPFREQTRPAGGMPRRLRWSVVGLGLVLALGVWWFLDARTDVPPRPVPAGPGEVVPPAPAAAPGAAPGAGRTPPQAPAPTPAPGDVPAPGASPSGSGATLVVAAQKPSWIEIRDAQGQVTLQRLLAGGEAIELQPPVPGTLTVGNAAGTRVVLKGQPIDLSAVSRENVARIELR